MSVHGGRGLGVWVVVGDPMAMAQGWVGWEGGGVVVGVRMSGELQHTHLRAKVLKAKNQ